MKPTAFLASLLTFAVMAAATPIDSIGRAASIQAAIEMNNALDVYNRMQTDESAMTGHTLCACQFAKHANLYLDATISACADLGGEMDIRDRKAGLGGIDFFGKYVSTDSMYFGRKLIDPLFTVQTTRLGEVGRKRL
ncbi:hypothetical protein Vi05172_g9777 [Venturia inaequalis]|nr:hypothetical protein Vi05172_g9777 [Venturia inaequalis]